MESGCNMICPKCGLIVPDGRDTCQSCGTVVNLNDGIFDNSPHEAIKPQNKPKVYRIETETRSIIIYVAGIIVVLFILIITPFLLNQVELEIIDVNVEGKTITITIKNKGWNTADSNKIEVKINDGTVYQWDGGDIKGGEEKSSQITVTNVILISVHILFEGREHDRKG